MKIDVVRKLPDAIDTLVLCHREDGKLDVFEDWLSSGMYDSIKHFVENEKITFKADNVLRKELDSLKFYKTVTHKNRKKR